jgi:hypothetical protein
VERGIYRAVKPVGVAGKIMKNGVCLMVPKSTFACYSFSRVRQVVAKHTSAWFPMCTIYRRCLVLLRVRRVRKFEIFKMPFQLSLVT